MEKDLTKTVELLLKEQHKNTRHDAIDIVLSLTNAWRKDGWNVPSGFIAKMETDIMNLKQREPNLPKNLKLYEENKNYL